jgi:hypothetical protein
VKPKKYSYYTIDTGFLGAPVKLCFSKESFQDILKDHEIVTKETALGLGIAETHSFTEGRNGLIVLVFDYSELVTDDDFSNVFATITHEAVHCVQRIFDWVGEEDPGEEITAYLTEWIVKQIIKGFTTERDKRAGTRNRKTINQKSERAQRAVSKILVDNLGRSGSISIDELKNLLRGDEGAQGSSKPQTKDSV